MTKTDRDSVERVEAFCTEAERRRDLHDRPHNHDKIFGLNDLWLTTSDLRALLTRAERAEANLAALYDDQSLTVAYLAGVKDGKAAAWDEAIEAAARSAKGQYNDTPMHDPESPFFGSDMSPDRSDWGRGIQRGRSQAASTIRAFHNPYRKDKTDDK